MIEISSATADDLDRLIEIYALPELERNAGESRWFVNCYFDYHHINVAKVDKKIQGTCFWRIEGEKCLGLGWIENLWVEKQHRRMGLGERLLKESIADMKSFYEKDGIRLRKIALTTQSYRNSAMRLYERIGFRKAASLSDMYDPRGLDFMYILDLNPKENGRKMERC